MIISCPVVWRASAANVRAATAMPERESLHDPRRQRTLAGRLGMEKFRAERGALMDLYLAVIFPWQCDHMGHMNVMYYVHAFDQAFASLLAEVGFTGDYMRSTGMGFADVKHEIEYKAEQRAGDRIAITGGFSKLGSSSAEVRLRMRNPDTGETAAVSRITSVHFNLTERRSEPMPEEAREKIEGRMIEPDE